MVLIHSDSYLVSEMKVGPFSWKYDKSLEKKYFKTAPSCVTRTAKNF